MDLDFQARAELDVDASALFDTLTTLPGIAGWWTPLVTGTPDVEGGQLELRFAGLDEHIRLHVERLEVDRALTWRCEAHTGHPEWVDTAIAFEIDTVEAGRCVLQLVHHGLTPALSCYEVCSTGWERFLPSLLGFASTGTGRPFSSKGLHV